MYPVSSFKNTSTPYQFVLVVGLSRKFMKNIFGYEPLMKIPHTKNQRKIVTVVVDVAEKNSAYNLHNISSWIKK